jgi:hypothetical protein
MQHPWWFPVGEITRHVLAYSASFFLFVLATLYGSAISHLVQHFVASKFVLHVVTALEYAIVVCDAIIIMILMVGDVLRTMRRLMQ